MIEQMAIAVFGALAIWMSQSTSPLQQKYAPLLGLAGQPAWIYATIVAEQWGILFLSVLYTLAWCRGVRNQWFPERGVLILWAQLKKEFSK